MSNLGFPLSGSKIAAAIFLICGFSIAVWRWSAGHQLTAKVDREEFHRLRALEQVKLLHFKSQAYGQEPIDNIQSLIQKLPDLIVHQKYTARFDGDIAGADFWYPFGLEVIETPERIIVTNVKPDSDAYKAGIRPGHLLSISKENQDNFHKVSNTLTLKVQSIGKQDSRQVTIAEDHFTLDPIGSVFRTNDSTLYVRPNHLGKKSYPSIMKAIENSVIPNTLVKIIFDLRNVPGESYQDIANLLSQFTWQRHIELFKIVSSNNKERIFKSTGRPFFDISSITIIIDESAGTAAKALALSAVNLDNVKIMGGFAQMDKLTYTQLILPSNEILFVPSGYMVFKSDIENVFAQNREYLTGELFSSARVAAASLTVDYFENWISKTVDVHDAYAQPMIPDDHIKIIQDLKIRFLESSFYKQSGNNFSKNQIQQVSELMYEYFLSLLVGRDTAISQRHIYDSLINL